MTKSLFQTLRLRGYGPRTLLDIGANLGTFTHTFLQEFPGCIPTLIEPNPHCVDRLQGLAYELIPAAASDKDGTAEIFLTKEWLESTGASLYKENTPYFRDDVVVKETVKTARLDSLFEGRSFDFVKIDVQGAELDVLNGGATILRKADYILIEVPVVEYNTGAPPAEKLFEKLTELGFRCIDAVEFHRLSAVMNGNLLQMDFLFERIVPRAAQDIRLTQTDRNTALDFIKTQRSACPDFSVLALGTPSAASAAWANDVLDATFGNEDRSHAPLHFSGNINDRNGWEPLLRYVEKHGKFSYSVCTNILEALANPTLVLDMLPLVSEAGFVAVPSKYQELSRPEGPWRGYVNNRWIFDKKKSSLVLIPKIPLVEYILIPKEKEETWLQAADTKELHVFWRKRIDYAVLNDDYLGPNAKEVVDMYSAALTE